MNNTPGSNPQPTNLFGQPKPTGGLFANAPPGNLFGGAAAAAGPPASSGSLFGPAPTKTPGAGSLFGGGSTGANPPSGATAPAAGTGIAATGGLFGTKPPATTGTSSFFGAPSVPGPSNPTPGTTGQTTGAPAAPPVASSLFGALGAKPAATPTPAASGGLFGSKPPAASGSLFGNASTTTPVNAASGAQPPAAAPAGGGLFGTASKLPDKKDAPAAGTTLGLFGALKSDDKTDTTTTAKAPVTTSLFGASKPNTATTTAAPTIGAQTSQVPTANIAVPPPSMLRGKTIEEIVNRWTTELETQVKEFNRFANEVAVWDRALAENGNNLAALNSYVLSAEREQSEIEQSLEHIEGQQQSLAATLDVYEKSTQEIMSQSGLRALDTSPADTERDKNYMLATELHTQLDDLAASLSQMIDSVNVLSSPSDGGEDDPMVQIGQILNSHLESLQWIDSTAGEVEGKITDIDRRVRESGLANSSMGRSKGYGLKR